MKKDGLQFEQVRYFLTRVGVEKEVTKEEWIRAERASGFRPKGVCWRCGPPEIGNKDCICSTATAGFSSTMSGISGRIEYVRVHDKCSKTCGCDRLTRLGVLKAVVLSKIEQQPQVQDSLKDQLRLLKDFANRLGLYDAADFIKSQVDP